MDVRLRQLLVLLPPPLLRLLFGVENKPNPASYLPSEPPMKTRLFV